MGERSANFTGGDTPLRLRGLRVSPTYFEVLGVGPAMGRAFSEEEERPGAPPVIIVSDGLWQSAFGGDPSILGRSVEFDGRPPDRCRRDASGAPLTGDIRVAESGHRAFGSHSHSTVHPSTIVTWGSTTCPSSGA